MRFYVIAPVDGTKYVTKNIVHFQSEQGYSISIASVIVYKGLLKYHVTVGMYHRFVYVSQVTGQVSLSQCIYQ